MASKKPEGQHRSSFQNCMHTPHASYNVHYTKANNAKTYIVEFIFKTGVFTWTNSRRCRGTTTTAIGVNVWRMFHWNRGSFLMGPLFFQSTDFFISSSLSNT
jgi:hypothetical protein